MVYVAAGPVYLSPAPSFHAEFGWLFVTFIAGMTVGSALPPAPATGFKPT